MDCEYDIKHKAFMVHWLSRFVEHFTDGNNVLPIVVCLARVMKITLAPEVLAVIYRI